MKHEKKEKILESLEKSLGIVSAACKEVGVARETYYRWLKEDEDFRLKVEEIHEMQGDFVEHQLLKKIKEGSEKAIMFYLKYRGKNRGYVNRSEITGADGQDLFKNLHFKFNSPNGDKTE
jgi:transposase-like protein